jgi:DNA-binding MarR family transcriptional regulator
MDPPAGRRGRGLHLTARGKSVIREAYPLWQEAQRRATETMGGDARSLLDGLLGQAEKLASP